MLILVAVTLTIALNGGLFEQASKSGTWTDYEAFREQLLADVVGAQAEIYGEGKIPDLDKIETILKRSDYGYTIEEKTTSYVKVKKNNNRIKIIDLSRVFQNVIVGGAGIRPAPA